jgi:hypothetical protein
MTVVEFLRMTEVSPAGAQLRPPQFAQAGGALRR